MTPSTSLRGKEDHYDGIIIDSEGLPDDPREFSEALQLSLKVRRKTCRHAGIVKYLVAKCIRSSLKYDKCP